MEFRIRHFISLLLNGCNDATWKWIRKWEKHRRRIQIHFSIKIYVRNGAKRTHNETMKTYVNKNNINDSCTKCNSFYAPALGTRHTHGRTSCNHSPHFVRFFKSKMSCVVFAHIIWDRKWNFPHTHDTRHGMAQHIYWYSHATPFGMHLRQSNHFMTLWAIVDHL